MTVDHRLVLQYEQGQMTFRHLRQDATYDQMFNLAEALNRFQDVPIQRVLLVSVREF